MSLLGTVASEAGIEEEKDFVGGGFQPFETDVYDMTIKLAYLDVSSGGAVSFNTTFESADGKELRNTQYITSGTSKGRRNYYEKNGKKYHLPGFTLVNNLCLLTVGKELSQLVPQEKTLKIYDYAAGGPVDKKKETLVELHGKQVALGVIKEVVDKVEKNDKGEYIPTGVTKEQNSISKVFRSSDKLTVPEIKAQVAEATFVKDWLEKHKGVTENNAKGAVASTPTAPSAFSPPASNPSTGDAFQTPTSLFAPKS